MRGTHLPMLPRPRPSCPPVCTSFVSIASVARMHVVHFRHTIPPHHKRIHPRAWGVPGETRLYPVPSRGIALAISSGMHANTNQEGRTMKPLEALRHHVSGAIERGENRAIVGAPEQYCKIRFVSKYHHGATAGLIVSETKLKGQSISDISRWYPYSEANKMDRLQRSPFFATWDEAFQYQFK